MIRNAYIVDSESWFWWFDKKSEATVFINRIVDEGQKDIQFRYSRIKIDKNDSDNFREIEVIETFKK